jgi:hypothetical protein
VVLVRLTVAMIGLLSLRRNILQIPQKRNAAQSFIPQRAIDPIEIRQRDLFCTEPAQYGAMQRRERDETALGFEVMPDPVAMGVGRGGEKDQSDIPMSSGSR